VIAKVGGGNHVGSTLTPGSSPPGVSGVAFGIVYAVLLFWRDRHRRRLLRRDPGLRGPGGRQTAHASYAGLPESEQGPVKL
jgi:hypothetical protein